MQHNEQSIFSGDTMFVRRFQNANADDENNYGDLG